MVAFWKNEPLTPEQSELMQLCLDAHCRSASRENISSVVVRLAARGSGDYLKSLVAALSTLGGKHAPLAETYELLTAEVAANDLMAAGVPVPGWGNSFHKGVPDPLWTEVDAALRKDFPGLAARIDRITAVLHKAGKMIFPNPSCFTAATAIAIGMPKEICPCLFVLGRLPMWTALFLDQARA